MTSQAKIKNQKSKTVPATRRKGKIARLPKSLRDKINSLLDDGASYPAIIKALQSSEPPLPFALSEQNLSRWKDGGYQDYLAAPERLQILRTAQESASDLIQNSDTTKLPEASLQLAASHLFILLGSLSSTNVAEDPESYTKLVTSLCRLNREILSLRKYHDTAKANEPVPVLSASRQLKDLERQLILDKADDILGCRAYRPQFLVPRSSRGPQSAERSQELGQQTGGELGKPNETLTSEQTEVTQSSTPTAEPSTHDAESLSTIEHPASNVQHPESNIQNPVSSASQPSTINPPPSTTLDLCPSCHVPLPRRLPNGFFPIQICPECREYIPDEIAIPAHLRT